MCAAVVCRWINRKASPAKYSRYMFHAGFLGMDNISCVDRSNLPSDCTTVDQVTDLSYLTTHSLSLFMIWLSHMDG